MRLQLVRSTLLAAIAFGTASVAFATPVTIDFNGVATGQNVMTSYTEHGFTVTNTSHWYTSTNGGNPQPNIASGQGIGGSSAYNTAVFSLTESGSLFGLNSFDLRTYTGNAVSYTIQGYSGATLLYTITSSDSTVGYSTITIPTLDQNMYITSATFTMSINSGATGTNARFGVDNIDVTTTPEPSSVALLATGMLGILFVMGRRRVFNL